jgi:hypothetical protein
MWKQVTVRLTGTSALIMHNGQLADPLNEGVKAMKKISGKRSKTEADFEALARLEYQGSLYMDATGRPVIPSHVLESVIVNGAKKSKDGLKAKAGMFVEKNAVLEYDGPKDRDGLWADPNFRLVAAVVVSRARVMRTRPVFNEWAATVIINYDDTQVNEAQVLEWLKAAGTQVGIGDWRPKYGRFEVSKAG